MIDLTKYTWLLFDFDNTIVNFHDSSLASFKDLCEEAGIVFSLEMYKIYKIENKKIWDRYERKQLDGKKLRWLRFLKFFEKIGCDFDPHKAHEIYISGLINHTPESKETSKLLASLSKTHKLAIITNGLKEAQRPRIKNAKLGSFFSEIIVSDEIKLAKPDRAYFNYTMEKINFHKKDKIVIIGDSLTSDIKGGMDSGIDTIWINPKNEKAHSKILPTFSIEKIHDLLN